MNANTTAPRWWKWAGAAILCWMLPINSQGAQLITLTVSPLTLTPNSTTSTVSVFAKLTGTAAGINISNMVLNISTGDAGVWGNPSDTGNTAPLISAVNFQPSGGLFTGKALSQPPSNFAVDVVNPNDTPSESQVWFTSIKLASGTLTLPLNTTVLLATATIDTSNNLGFSGNTWPIYLDNGPNGNGNSSFGSANPTVQTAANITTGPEPASLGLLAVVVPTLFLRRRRRVAA